MMLDFNVHKSTVVLTCSQENMNSDMAQIPGLTAQVFSPTEAQRALGVSCEVARMWLFAGKSASEVT